MKPENFKKLERGDIVRHKTDHRTDVVDANYGNRVTVVRVSNVTNPHEWELVAKAKYEFIRDEA
jgi:hypothetical protein